MYIPEHFRESNSETLHSFMAAYPLATVVTSNENGLEANHLPLMLSTPSGSKSSLRGHIARGNPLGRNRSSTPCLVIFQGPDHYISPNWYPMKKEHGRAVPTWNYLAVHLHGQLTVIDDIAWLRSMVTRLTDRHESQFDQPWKVTDAPEAYIDKLLLGIVGIEISVDRIEGKWKVSQNQTEANRAGVVQGLCQLNQEAAQQIAQEVKRSLDSKQKCLGEATDRG